MIAQAPADPAGVPEVGELPGGWAWGVEVASAIAASLKEVISTDAKVSDTVFAQVPPSWSVEGWRLLGLAGLALWSWPHGLPRSERDTPDKPVKKSPAPIR